MLVSAGRYYEAALGALGKFRLNLGALMRAAVFNGPGEKLAIESRPVPQPDLGELLLKVAYCGICGSDLHATQEGAFLQPKGVILGHEFSAEVSASAAEGWSVGDRVVGIPIVECDDCRALGQCRLGLGMACARAKVIGLNPSAPGAYAEFVKIRASKTLRVPDDLDLKIAALAEPIAVAAHAIRKAGPLFGARVLIIGAGPIGLAVLLCAMFAGVTSVSVSELDDARGLRAREFGATHVFNPGKDEVRRAYYKRFGAAPLVVFECVGAKGLLQQAIDCCAPGGSVVVVGVCVHDDVIKPFSAITKELRIQFALGYDTDDFVTALELLGSNRVDSEKLITRVIDMEELPDTFEELRKPNSHAKVLLRPSA